MNKQNISIKKYFTNLLLCSTFFFSPFALSEITLDGSMGQAGTLPGPNHQITEDLGQRAGNNLFHSFGKFNLSSTESATFSGSAGIKNVISRVTGGQASTIDGAFRSTIPGANVYFLNPAGVIFGENAKLDVQGSFHASTADYLKFKNGVKFETGMATANPILTTAAPEAFGFLDNTPAKIEVLGGNNKLLEVPEDETLSLVGGDISINDRSIYAPGGHVVLASARSAGEVVMTDSGIDISSFTKGGNINISHGPANPVTIIDNDKQIADIDVSANTGGKVIIRGGQMIMNNTSISANTINGNGEGIDIGLAGNLTIDGIAETLNGEIVQKNSISANTQGIGDAGNIDLAVNELKLTNGTKIGSATSALGNGGDLKITADSIFLEGNDSNIAPSLATNTSGSGDSGNLSINTNNLKVLNSATISSISLKSATGKSGEINIKANDTISLSGEYGGIHNFSDGEGDTDNLTVISNKLDIKNGANISGTNYGSGNGGDLFVNAKEIILTNDNLSWIDDLRRLDQTGIHSDLIGINHNNSNTATSGNLTVKSEKLTIRNGALLSASNLRFQGNSGNLTVESNEILLTSNMDILTSNEDIDILGGIMASNIGLANSGNLSIFSDKLVVTNGASIMTGSASGGLSNITGTFDTGNSTNLVIHSNTILLSRNGAKQLTGIRADATLHASGKPESMTINSDSLTIQNGAQINTGTRGEANSGDLFINSKYISLTGEASMITTLTSSTGNAGNIFIKAENIDLSGKDTMIYSTSSYRPNQSPDVPRPLLGNAGSITIEGLDNLKNDGGMRVKQLAVHDYASISTYTENTGEGGDLIIKADYLDIYNNSQVITGTEGSGNSGNLQIDANKVHLQDHSAMMTFTTGIGQGGNLTVTAEDLILNNGLLFSGSTLTDFDNSDNPALAKSGSIEITTTNTIRLNENSIISAETEKANAGEININAGKLLHLSNSDITTSVANGEGTGGHITLNTPIVALDKSIIIAKADEGTGGEINFSGFRFQSPNSIVNASSNKGSDGTIVVNKPDTDISGSLAVLPESLLNISDQFSDRCSSRSGENSNSFVVKNREGIPVSPGKLIPSTFQDYSPSASLPVKNTGNKDNNFIENSGLFTSANKSHFPLSSHHVDCNL